MAVSKRNVSKHPRRAPVQEESNSGRIWSVIVVILLLAGGALWAYLSNDSGDGEGTATEEVASTFDSANETLGQVDEGATDTMVEPGEGATDTMVEPGESATDTVGDVESAPETRGEVTEGAADSAAADEDERATDTIGAVDESATDTLGAVGERATDTADQAEESAQSAIETEVTERAESDVSTEFEFPTTTTPTTPESADAADSGSAAVETEIEEIEEVEETVAATTPAEQVATERAAAGDIPETVTVESGDSLSSIAERVYGTSAKWELIYEANRDQLDSPHNLRIGMKLSIPPSSD